MVVSVKCQSVGRKKHQIKTHSRSRVAFRRSSIPLYLVPYITALFIFSISINLVDSLWQFEEPDFTLGELSLPGEFISEETGPQVLKAEVPLLLPEKSNNTIHFSEYKIRDEDRYSIIARKFDISIDTLISVNETKSGKIIPGSILKIPSQSGIMYTVDKGDTLSSISRKYNIEIEEISRSNNLLSTVIHVNDKLFLPGAEFDRETRERILGNKFIIPAAGSVKNDYGTQTDPVTGLKNYNYGIDIVNKKGTAVYAAADGVVGSTSYNSYYGRVIQLNHSGSMQSMYSCLDSIVVKPDETVQRGDLIGYMGNSGFKATEHLQFSIFRNKEDVDTLEFIF